MKLRSKLFAFALSLLAVTAARADGIVNGGSAQTTFVIPDNYGAVDRTGATDDGAVLNTAIAAAQSCNAAVGKNTVLRVTAGTYLITTALVPKSCVTIEGDGRGKTIFLTNNAAPFAQAAGSQLVHFNMSGISFKDSGSHASATVLSFTAIQGSRLENLGFFGYSSGTLMSIAGATVTSFDDNTAPWNNSNSIFNLFSDWVSDGCTNCIKEAGAYGATPTASPVNSSNVPSIVVTQNRYDNFYVEGVAGKFIDLIKAADSEVFTRMVVFLNSNSGIAAQIGDDNANFPGNNYVNSIRLQISVSMSSPATGIKLFDAGDWTFGNVFDLETDIAASAITAITLDTSVTQFNYSICGKNYLAPFNGAVGNTNDVCISNAVYTRFANGTAALPIDGFLNDSGNGRYLKATNITAFSKLLQADGGFVAGGSAPTPTGTCSTTAQSVGNTAGKFGASGACASGTYILTFAVSATTGWSCTITDLTTGAATARQTAYTANSATFTVSGVLNSDSLTFGCQGF